MMESGTRNILASMINLRVQLFGRACGEKRTDFASTFSRKKFIRVFVTNTAVFFSVKMTNLRIFLKCFLEEKRNDFASTFSRKKI